MKLAENGRLVPATPYHSEHLSSPIVSPAQSTTDEDPCNSNKNKKNTVVRQLVLSPCKRKTYSNQSASAITVLKVVMFPLSPYFLCAEWCCGLLLLVES